MRLDKTVIFTGALVGVNLLCVGVLISSSVSADNTDIVDEVNITVPISCTLSGSGMTSHNASIPNGTYTDDIGTTTLKAFCNDNSGFAIYAVGYTGNEIGATNSTKLVGTSASNNATIDTGTATGPVSGNDTSNWAMKLQTVSSPTPTYPITIDNSFSNYSAVPSSYTKVAHRDNGTDIGQSAEGSTLTTTYAAYISKTQAADTYTGQVKYTLVHPASEEPKDPNHKEMECEAGQICYYPDTSAVVGSMGNQSVSDGNSVTLYASNFKRDGYGFAGWNDKYDYTGTFYGPNQTITAPTGTTANGLSLYAVWIKSAGSLQSDATTACNGLTEDPNDGTADLSSVTALTDERDGNTYAIAKLADGKCWMIENLRLADKDSNNNDIILSSSNTHNPSLPLTNIYDTSTASNHLSPTSSVVYDATTTPGGWCKTSSTACIDQSRLRTDNTALYTNNTVSSYSASGNVYSYGNYYNWYSATAGHGKYGNNYGSGYNAPGDICPAGWHLPTGKDATGDFGVLDIALGGTGTRSSSSTDPTGSVMSSRYRSYPNNFVYSGYVNGDGASILSRNSYGYYWSASGSASSYAYSVYFVSTLVIPGTNGTSSKFAGWMVRCVAGV